MRGRDLDDPETTRLRHQLLAEKNFLNRLYQDWYRLIVSGLPHVDGPVVELGSGAGFLDQFLPEVIQTEYLNTGEVQVVLNAHDLPFPAKSLRAIVMVNVFHHLQEADRFIFEAHRTVKNTGRIILIEPWVTGFSKFVYSKFHHEPFDPHQETWRFLSDGPLSGANGALPWIIFKRDREKFENRYPQWKISEITPMMPFRYLFSGGLGFRSLVPGQAYPFVVFLEKLVEPWLSSCAMFARIVLDRI